MLWGGTNRMDVQPGEQLELLRGVQRAREQGDVDNGSLLIGQDAGLIDSIEPAGEIVGRIVSDAEAILTRRLAEVLPAPLARA